jgi:hypothetical protein
LAHLFTAENFVGWAEHTSHGGLPELSIKAIRLETVLLAGQSSAVDNDTAATVLSIPSLMKTKKLMARCRFSLFLLVLLQSSVNVMVNFPGGDDR